MTVKPGTFFWSIEGIYIYHHRNEPRGKLYLRKEESFPIPLRFIDVVRRTNHTLDALLESRIDDYWNVDGDRNLSEPWSGFTQFTIVNPKRSVGG